MPWDENRVAAESGLKSEDGSLVFKSARPTVFDISVEFHQFPQHIIFRAVFGWRVYFKDFSLFDWGLVRPVFDITLRRGLVREH